MSAAEHASRSIEQSRNGNVAAAIEEARLAVAADPDNAPLQAHLGQLLTATGVYEEAASAYLAAVALDPTFEPAQVGAALVLYTLGRHTQALEHARRSVELADRPGSAALLAMIEGALQGNDRAAARLAEVAARFPNDATVLVALARTLLKAERPAEALDAAERAAQCAPTQAVVFEMLGVALQAMSRHEDALAAFDRGQALAPRSATLLAKRGGVLVELGRSAEAAHAFAQALAHEPDSAPAWYGRVDLAEVPPTPADVEAMERALATSPRLRAYDDRVAMHFAAGRTALAYGDLERAFAHLGAGNRMKRALLRYDVAEDERIMRDIARNASAEFLAHTPPGDPSDVPVFVVGMPRSGTTLVEQILGAHPAIYAAGELSALPNAIAALLAAPEPRDLAAAGRAYVETVRRLAPNAPRIVDKLPANFLRAGLIRVMLPNARIVHVRRDPLDTCVSCYTTLFEGRQDFSYDLAELGRFYRAYLELMEHWRAVLPAERFFEIDYEAVVADLEGSARRLIAFAGLPWDDACLRFNAARRPIRTASKSQVRRPIFTTSVGRAQRYRPYLQPLVEALHLE